MADHLRKQIRDAAAAAFGIGAVPTAEGRVFENRTYELQDNEMPALRVYTHSEAIKASSLGLNRLQERVLELMVECCSKKVAGMDDELDALIKEVEVAVANNQGMGGAKWVQLAGIEIEMVDEADREIGVARMIFQVHYVTALSAPDVAH